jgi:hypothetical protein
VGVGVGVETVVVRVTMSVVEGRLPVFGMASSRNEVVPGGSDTVKLKEPIALAFVCCSNVLASLRKSCTLALGGAWPTICTVGLVTMPSPCGSEPRSRPAVRRSGA